MWINQNNSSYDTKASELKQEQKKSKIVQKAGKHKFTRDTLSDPRKANNQSSICHFIVGSIGSERNGDDFFP